MEMDELEDYKQNFYNGNNQKTSKNKKEKVLEEM